MGNLVALARIVRAAFSRAHGEDLCGYCWRASAQLFLLARSHGIADARLGATYWHVFVVRGDRIVDVTATQFGLASGVTLLPLDRDRRLARLARMGAKVRRTASADPWSPHLLVDSIEELENLGWETNYFLEEDRRLVLER